MLGNERSVLEEILVTRLDQVVKIITRRPGMPGDRKIARGLLGGLDNGGQAIKGARGMSWHKKALKGVEDCEKSGVVVKRALIPEFPS